MSKVRAWIRPLKDEATQYFATCPEGGSVYGAAHSTWTAHDVVCTFLYDHGHKDDWDLEVKPALGKWEGS